MVHVCNARVGGCNDHCRTWPNVCCGKLKWLWKGLGRRDTTPGEGELEDREHPTVTGKKENLQIAIAIPDSSLGLVRTDDPLFVFNQAPPLILRGESVTMSLLSRGPATIHHSNNSNFSIDHILHVAGRKHNSHSPEYKHFDWLNCTRYRPPKLPRQRKKEGIQRRTLGRNPRIPFSSSQVAFLEAKFLRTPYLSSSDVTQLASYLKLSETKVKIWFQNRRAREKRERDTKSKSEQDFQKNISDIPPSPLLTLPSPTLPLPPPPSPSPSPFPLPFPFSSSSSSSFAPHHHINPSALHTYLQLLPPLDLTQRRFICKPTSSPSPPSPSLPQSNHKNSTKF